MQTKTIRVPVKEPMWDLGQEPGAIPGIVGRCRAAMGHARHGLECHGNHLVVAMARCGGDKADAAGVVLASGIEGGPCKGRGVSGIELTGTGRVDPLPIGGHGAS
jgi:hypothetical protein